MKHILVSILLLPSCHIFAAEAPEKKSITTEALAQRLVVTNALKEQIRINYIPQGTTHSWVNAYIEPSKTITLLPIATSHITIYMSSKVRPRSLAISPTDTLLTITKDNLITFQNEKIAVVSSDEEIEPCIQQ